MKNNFTQIFQKEKNLNENELNKSIEFLLICISLSKNQKDFQHFIFYNSVLELLKTDNN